MENRLDVVEVANGFMDEYSDVFVALAQEKQACEEREDRDGSSVSE